MDEDALISRLQVLTDQSQSVPRRDERFLAALLILTRLPALVLQRWVKTDQTILRFGCGLISDYISHVGSSASIQGKKCTTEKERGAYLALSACFFAKYYMYVLENVTIKTQPTQLDRDVHAYLLKAIKLRSLSEIPLGPADIDIVTSLGRIVRCCTVEKRGLIGNPDGRTVVKSGSPLDDWIQAPTHLLRRCIVNKTQHADASAKKNSSVHPFDQDELARCLMLNTIGSVLITKSPGQEADSTEAESFDYCSQYAEAVIIYLEAHLDQSLSSTPYDLRCSVSASVEAVNTPRYSSPSEPFSLPYERAFLLDLFRYAVDFPRIDQRNGNVAAATARLRSLALMYLSYSARGNWRSIGQFDLGKTLESCKADNQACSDDDITAAVLELILHCVLVEPAIIDAKVQGGARAASVNSLTFEAIAILVGACDLHWMVRDVNISLQMKAGASSLDKGAALCLVIRIVVGNLRMGLGRLIDHIAEDVFASADSSSDSLNLIVDCVHTLNSTLKFVLSVAEGMGDTGKWSTTLNAEALLHIRSSIEDAINSAIQFLVDPVAGSYCRVFFGTSGQIQVANDVEKYTNKRSAYECAVVACCSFLGAYFAEESVFVERSSRSAEVASANDIFSALLNGLRVCLSVDVRESQQVASKSPEETGSTLAGKSLEATSGTDCMSGRSLISLLPCLAIAVAELGDSNRQNLSIEKGEEDVCFLATTILKEGLCTSAVCFVMRDLLFFANSDKKEPEVDSRVLSAYICCCDLVKALLMIDQVARGEAYPCEAAKLREREKEEMQACLLLWSRYLVRQCANMITAHRSNYDTKSAEGMLALILTSESLTLLLDTGVISPEASSAIKEASELIGDFPA